MFGEARCFIRAAKSSCGRPPGRETGDILMRSVRRRSWGFPPSVVAHLFEPSPSGRRVGYALILGREIMLAHGGWMEVESTQESGLAWHDDSDRVSRSLTRIAA